VAQELTGILRGKRSGAGLTRFLCCAARKRASPWKIRPQGAGNRRGDRPCQPRC
jgi:hypothetical protein